MNKTKKARKKANKPLQFSPQDKKWRAECDAHTLAEAAAIHSDSARMTAAQKAAVRMVDLKERQAKAAQAEAKAIKVLAGK